MFAPIARPLNTLPRTPRRSLLQRLFRRDALWRSRKRLADLPPTLLRDIGLDECEARAEAARPIWDAPRAWRD